MLNKIKRAIAHEFIQLMIRTLEVMSLRLTMRWATPQDIMDAVTLASAARILRRRHAEAGRWASGRSARPSR